MIGVFFKFTQPRLQIARGRRLCHFVDGGLIEILRLFREQGIFHNVCNKRSDVAKITYTARRCLRIARSTSSEREFLLRHIVTKYTSIGGDRVLHPVIPQHPNHPPVILVWNSSSVLNWFESYLTSVLSVLNVIRTSLLSIFLLVVLFQALFSVLCFSSCIPPHSALLSPHFL